MRSRSVIVARVAAVAAVVGVVGVGAVVTGCSVLGRELGDSSTDGVAEAIEDVLPGSEVEIVESTSGLTTQFAVEIEIADATTVTGTDVAATVTALCAAEPRGYDNVDLSIWSAAPGSRDRVFADVPGLLAELRPELEVLATTANESAYVAVDDLCAADGGR